MPSQLARRSLRRTLLIWLLLPLLALFSIGTVVVYQIALSYSEDAYDRGLFESANDMLQLTKESLQQNGKVLLSPAASKMLLSDQYDVTYMSVWDERGKLLAGDGKLAFVPFTKQTRSVAKFYDAYADNVRVRAIMTTLHMEVGGQEHFWQIIVAETRNKRDQLADDIITGFVIPQIIIILLAAIMVMFGVRRGLEPLETLRMALANRSHNDMHPLNVPDMPAEVRPLTEEINHLLARLQSVFEVQKQFTADAAHQLRTPLAGLAAQTDFAREQPNPPQTQHALDQIKIVSARLNHAVNQLLSIARNEPGAEKSIQKHAIDLNEMARNSTMEWVETAVKNSIDLGFDGTDSPVVISGDPTRLKEMLDNLVDNALRYCPRGSSVTVRVEGDHSLSVEDNGPGIPPEERERVFERFHRLLGTEADGNGLGLAIVREIAELHSAEVTLTEGAGGRGALFRVHFPALAESEAADQ